MSVCSSAGILGTGHYAPERLLTNFDLEKLVDTTDEWIRTRTGVETRHLAAASENTSDLCVKAGWKALEAAGLTAEDIDFVMVATASPDYVVPSTACLVQDKMGMKRAGGMDISAGCSGYIYAVATAAAMVKAGLYKYILVVGAEILSRLVNWQDRSTCILFGDGAGADGPRRRRPGEEGDRTSAAQPDRHPDSEKNVPGSCPTRSCRGRHRGRPHLRRLRNRPVSRPHFERLAPCWLRWRMR